MRLDRTSGQPLLMLANTLLSGREVVVRDGELDLIALLLELDDHARGLLAAIKLVVHGLEGVGEPARRIVFEHGRL